MVKKRNYTAPRMLISALRGSSAKTIVSLGIISALKRRNIQVMPFKKGPDYIDAAWLTHAAGTNCEHLDLYLMGEQGVREVFYASSHCDGLSLIEGNRGIFDGVDIHGSYSTAKIARILNVPVLLIVDCSKMTNTATSMILGCKAFDPHLPLQGIILNRIAGKRHGDLIRSSIEHHTEFPVVGSIPNVEIKLPERHLGLTTVSDVDEWEKQIQSLGDIAEQYLDIDKIINISQAATPLPRPVNHKEKPRTTRPKTRVKIGIIRDAAFQFYYAANLKALEAQGAEWVEFNSMEDRALEPVDLLYIPGGFPEVYAEKISRNSGFRESVKTFAQKGLPIYGECGAVIYLGRRLEYNKRTYQMCDVFPLDFKLQAKPAGHGYTEIQVDRDNPFFPKGAALRGHEFHYSLPVNWNGHKNQTAFCINRGFGIDGKRDGLFIKNVFVTYTHVHSAGYQNWAKCLIDIAKEKQFHRMF